MAAPKSKHQNFGAISDNFATRSRLSPAEMEMGQWVMDHGSNGSPFLDESRESLVIASDPLTRDDKITAQ